MQLTDSVTALDEENQALAARGSAATRTGSPSMASTRTCVVAQRRVGVDALRLVGFDELTPAQSQLVERLRTGGVDIAVEPPAMRRGELSRVDCDDAAGELDAAARWAAEGLDRRPAARLAIVVPDLAARRAEVRPLKRICCRPRAIRYPLPGSRVFEIAAPPLAERAIVVPLDLQILTVDADPRPAAACSTTRI
jgi:hypothetical protein